MMMFHLRVEHKYLILKVPKTALPRVKTKRDCCSRAKVQLEISLNHIQEAAVRGLSRFRARIMMFLMVLKAKHSPPQPRIKHPLFLDNPTETAKSSQNLPLKTSSNQREENPPAEWHPKTKSPSPQIKATWTIVYCPQALVELKTVLSRAHLWSSSSRQVVDQAQIKHLFRVFPVSIRSLEGKMVLHTIQARSSRLDTSNN